MSGVYDSIGERYESLITDTVHVALGELVTRLLPDEALRPVIRYDVIDLACGTGVVGARLASIGDRRRWTITGIDQSDGMTRLAATRYDRVICTNATKTDEPDMSVNLVLCTYAWTDVEDWEGLVQEAHRLLKPNGWFITAGRHPMTGAPDSVRLPDGSVTVTGGSYLEARHAMRGLGFTPGGFRDRVGMWHRPEHVLIAPLLEEGWVLRRRLVAYGDPPALVGYAARKVC